MINALMKKFHLMVHGIILEIVEVDELKQWLNEVIENHPMHDIPLDFFDLVNAQTSYVMHYIHDLRLTELISPHDGSELMHFYINKHQLKSSQCLQNVTHLLDLFYIAERFQMDAVYTYLSLLHADDYVNDIYPDRNADDFLALLDEIWASIMSN